MPSKSPKQARLMAGVAHNPEFAKEVGIPRAVGKEFNEADRRSQQSLAVAVRRPRGRPRIRA